MERRIKEIIERGEGKILDIECIQHSLENIKSDSWLDGKLAEIIGNFTTRNMLKAKNILGRR